MFKTNSFHRVHFLLIKQINLPSITYILSGVQKALAFEWLCEGLRNDFNLSFILINGAGGELSRFLEARGVPVWAPNYGGKKDAPRLVWQIAQRLRCERPNVVHAHLFEAGYLGLTAAALAGVRRRIYTRHYATLNHVYYPHAVRLDKYINRLATEIVAVSPNVRDVLLRLEGAPARKVRFIPHGFDLVAFSEVSTEMDVRVAALRQKYDLSVNKFLPVVGVIGRYVRLKGHTYIIEAFARLREKFPQATLILANATGEDALEIRRALAVLPQEAYREIPFENDLPALYRLFDIYVHAPIDPQVEAFGQTYIEALASGTPSIFTLSGIAPEFIRDNENALVVPFKDSGAIYQATLRLLSDGSLRTRLVENGRASLASFTLEKMINAHRALYRNT